MKAGRYGEISKRGGSDAKKKKKSGDMEMQKIKLVRYGKVKKSETEGEGRVGKKGIERRRWKGK